MNTIELPYFVVLSIILIMTPFMSSDILIMFDSLIVRIMIVLLLLFLITVGPTAGIFGLLVVGAIYLERNRRKISYASKKLDLIDVNYLKQMTVEEESKPQTTLPVVEFNIPSDPNEMPYLPTEDCGSDNFEPVASTINSKEVLPVIENGSKADIFYERLGFGHIDGVHSLGEI
jgi:hypothetical protein